MKIKYIKTSRTKPIPNNNSSDIITGNFINGCLGGCWKSYCFSSRYNSDTVYVSTNIDEIIDESLNWVNNQQWPKISNQQDSTYYMLELFCNSDASLMQKYIDLEYILKSIDNHPKANTTFATKYSSMLNLDVNDFNKKPRVRISIMPETPMKVLEPNTTDLETRISDIERLEKLGWEVHINFAPIVIYDNWIQDYKDLITRIPPRPCEVIFLTNHVNTMNRVSDDVKEYLQYSNEIKNQNGVMRYPIEYKRKAVLFINNLLETNGFKVRYIF